MNKLPAPAKIVLIYLTIIAILALMKSDILLLASGILAGVFFYTTLRAPKKLRVDEREELVREKAARITYSIYAPTIGIAACILILFGRLGFYYLESLGLVLAYLTLFLIIVYTISYFYINREYGGGHHEE